MVAKCKLCGKSFQYPSGVERHLKRKYPCNRVDQICDDMQVSLQSKGAETQPASIFEAPEATTPATEAVAAENTDTQPAVVEATPPPQEEAPVAPPEPVEAPAEEEVVEPRVLMEVTPFTITLQNPLKQGSSIVLWGKSKTGKTTLMLKILDEFYAPLDNKMLQLLFLQNPQAEIYDQVSHNAIVSETFHPEVISALHKVQRKTNNKYPTLVILDDQVGIKNSLMLKKLILTLRNSAFSTIVSTQSHTLLAKQARGSVNFHIYKCFSSTESIEQVLKTMLMGYPPFNGAKNLREAVQMYMQLLPSDKPEMFLFLDTLNGTLTYHEVRI